MRWIRVIALAVLALASPASAVPWLVGSTPAAIPLEDQHGVAGAIDATAKLVLFTSDMDAGDVLKPVLADFDDAKLQARDAVYVADVSRMPGMILRLFALPKLRDRPYRMLLDRDGKATADLPRREKEVTLVTLEQGRITAVAHTADPAVLRAALAGALPVASNTPVP